MFTYDSRYVAGGCWLVLLCFSVSDLCLAWLGCFRFKKDSLFAQSVCVISFHATVLRELYPSQLFDGVFY